MVMWKEGVKEEEERAYLATPLRPKNVEINEMTKSVPKLSQMDRKYIVVWSIEERRDDTMFILFAGGMHMVACQVVRR